MSAQAGLRTNQRCGVSASLFRLPGRAQWHIERFSGLPLRGQCRIHTGFPSTWGEWIVTGLGVGRDWACDYRGVWVFSLMAFCSLRTSWREKRLKQACCPIKADLADESRSAQVQQLIAKQEDHVDI